MTEEPETNAIRQELRRLTLEKENAELRSRVSSLELQTGQLTDRLLRIGGNCSSCGI